MRAVSDQLHNVHCGSSVGQTAETTQVCTVSEQPYRSFSRELRETFGRPVRKIALDAGLTCPNRDGTCGVGGCAYCDAHGSGPGRERSVVPVAQQISEAVARGPAGQKYLAYFQAFSNTHAPAARLRSLFEEALRHPAVVGLDIATRPDCVPESVLGLIEELSKRTYLWLELGLQSGSDDTLRRVNRGHTAAQFVDAVQRARMRGIRVCAHVIYGFPWESRHDMRSTALLVARCAVEGVKFHNLYLVPGTPLAADVGHSRFPLLSREAYASAVADALELLAPDTVIQRLTGDPPAGVPPVPAWCGDKHATIRAIVDELGRRGSRQGDRFPA